MGNSNKKKQNTKQQKENSNSKQQSEHSNKQMNTEAIIKQKGDKFDLKQFTDVVLRELQNLNIHIGALDIDDLRTFRFGLTLYYKEETQLWTTVTAEIQQRVGRQPKLAEIATIWWSFYTFFCAAFILIVGAGYYNIITIMASNLENKNGYIVGCAVGGAFILALVYFGSCYRTPQSFQSYPKPPKSSEVANIWKKVEKGKNSKKKQVQK